MPTEASVSTFRVVAGNPAVYIARILGLDGAYLQQADVSSIAYTVYDLDNASAQVTTGTFTPSSTIYDTLQTGQIWTQDELGYNFKATLPAACFPTGNRRYRLVFSFTTGSWGVIKEPSEWHTINPEG